MLTSIEGIYRDGQIELREPTASVPDGTPVIVTFMGSSGVDLRAEGISQAEAAELHGALAAFGDWKEPDMDIYDDYDAARSNL